MKRHEILKNRKKWIKFLQNPKRKKAKEYLDIGKGERCCIGHGCYVLSLKKTKNGDGWDYEGSEGQTAPEEFQYKVGLKNSVGGIVGSFILDTYTTTLTGLNDSTDTTPQEIGDYLESVIEGGYDTPFIPLTDYEE